FYNELFNLPVIAGQYLAFIHYYTKINGRPPANADFQAYFHADPASVQHMIIALEHKGLINKIPRTPRTISLAVPKCCIPDLD
uniref:LexA family protein n=3 Tax=Facilibium subflavum TaxID=2219058 RepID=UPI002E2629CB